MFSCYARADKASNTGIRPLRASVIPSVFIIHPWAYIYCMSIYMIKTKISGMMIAFISCKRIDFTRSINELLDHEWYLVLFTNCHISNIILLLLNQNHLCHFAHIKSTHHLLTPLLDLLNSQCCAAQQIFRLLPLMVLEALVSE